jgi:hypothetical protein
MTTAATAERAAQPNDLVELGLMEYGGEQFRLTIGRDAELVDQIIVGAQEPLMQRMVPKDGKKRFHDPASFESWYAKDRFLVALRDTQGELAAIIWFGPSALDAELDELEHKSAETGIALDMVFGTDDGGRPTGCNDTFAIRVYEGHRDKARPDGENMSFARRFMNEAQGLYEGMRLAAGDPVKRIWLTTNTTEYDSDGTPQPNGAVYLYAKAGFEPVGTFANPDPSNREERIIMATLPFDAQGLGDLAVRAS